jgi:hypothetical protein
VISVSKDRRTMRPNGLPNKKDKYELVYNIAIICVRRALPSVSSAALSMKGWSDGQSERFGSARF